MAEKLCDIAARYVIDLGFGIIPLKKGGKEPASKNGVKDWADDPNSVRAYFEKNPERNIGAALGDASHNVIVIDVDKDGDKGYDGWDDLRAWELEHGDLPETVTAITGRGGSHLFYRVDREIHNSVNEELHVDVRSTGGYVVLPPSFNSETGTRYEWENHPDDYEIAKADDNVYAYIDHVQNRRYSKGFKKFKLPRIIKEGGRNNILYKYGCHLQSMSYDDDLIRSTLETTNQMQCKPPIPDDELEKLVRSVLELEKGLSPEAQEAKKRGRPAKPKFDHAEFGDMMIDEHHVCTIDGALAVWNGKSYSMGNKAVEAAMVSIKNDIKARDRAEVLKFLELKAPVRKMADRRYIAFDNCVLNIETMKTCEMTPDFYIPNVIPHEYDKDANDPVVLETLERMAQGDANRVLNLLEIIGLCIYRGTEMATAPILYGEGSNGKSTYLNMLHAILGDDNTASLDIATIGERFQTIPLIGKLANIGDDISNEFVSGSKASVVKKVITGDYIQGEYKGGSTFSFKPYCTLVFSCNEVPRLGDSSNGMIRRLHPVRFGATFSKSDSDYDPYIEDKLTSECAVQTAVNLGIWALKGVIERRGMFETDDVREAIENIKETNSTVYQFASDDLGYGTDEAVSIDGESTADLYQRYQEYCTRMHIRYPVEHRSFTREMKRIYMCETNRKWLEFEGGRKQVRCFKL